MSLEGAVWSLKNVLKWCHLSQRLLGLKTTSLKMKKILGCGVREKWAYQTSVAPHLCSRLEAPGYTSWRQLSFIVCIMVWQRRRMWEIKNHDISTKIKSRCITFTNLRVSDSDPRGRRAMCMAVFHSVFFWYNHLVASLKFSNSTYSGFKEYLNQAVKQCFRGCQVINISRSKPLC